MEMNVHSLVQKWERVRQHRASGALDLLCAQGFLMYVRYASNRRVAQPKGDANLCKVDGHEIAHLGTVNELRSEMLHRV